MTTDLGTIDPGEWLEFGRQVLEAQPFNSLVGGRLVEFGPGRAVLELDVQDRHRQQFGLVHGGVLCYLADNALTFAGGSVLGPSVVTAGVSIDYLRGARSGTLRAVAEVTHHDDREALCAARIEEVADDGAARLCARARGRIAVTRAAQTGASDRSS